MRTAALALLVIVTATGPAAADPQTTPAAKKKKPAAEQPQVVPAAAPAPAQPKIDLTPVFPPLPRLDSKVDLFPPAVLGDPSFTMSGGAGEKRPGLSFGGGWKREAAMIGAMSAGFAALVGLCGGGQCLLPDWLPGTPDAGPGVSITSPQPDQRIRQSR